MRQTSKCHAGRIRQSTMLLILAGGIASSAAVAANDFRSVGVSVFAQAPGQQAQTTTTCVAINDQVKASYVRTNGKSGAITFSVKPSPPGEPEGVPKHFDWKVSQIHASDETGDQGNGTMGYAVTGHPLSFTFGLKPDSVDIKITLTTGCKT